jgi:hypothetical protein
MRTSSGATPVTRSDNPVPRLSKTINRENSVSAR